MLKEVAWSEDRSYRTGSDTEPVQFYMDGLCNSNRFDLLLGYFSSAAINVLSIGFASFLYNGGILRMAINNVLSQEDKDAIKAGREGVAINTTIDITDINSLKNSLDDYGQHFFECLAWLIANEKIQIKIIKPKYGKGIAHYKSGAFYDGIDTVGFKASCNFTAFGLLENLEELDAFLSWENSRSSKMINRQNKDFEDIFSGTSNVVEYLEIGDILVAIKNEFGNRSINELLIKEKELAEKKTRLLENKGIKKSFAKAIIKIEEIIIAPRFPFSVGPRSYQMDAYSNWAKNNNQGIFAMATGTGKTLTALYCLLELYNKQKSYRAIIIVPTVGLAVQWENECKAFNFKNILKVNSKNNWENELAFINLSKNFIDNSFIIITTYASFTKKKFQAFFIGLQKDTLIIADEVHNMGAPGVVKVLENIKLEKRIGLSATPKRMYDDLGGDAIDRFFNDKEPYVYNYSMETAIKNGILCNYLYYPHIVKLTEVEFEEYKTISKQLARFFDSKEGKYLFNEEVERLLLKRKRIIHKAQNKLEAFKDILNTEFKIRGNLKYTLVYVPEGIEPNYSSDDNAIEIEDDINLLNQYTKIVGGVNKSIMVKQYTGSTPNREELISDFRSGIIHTLTSMKCLDEGIDVPRSELAIFCSSTGNPRQFIQRRGRVLRRHPDKIYATIHDLVVIPDVNNNENTFSMERSIVQKELERVVNFAELADNKTETYEVFKEVLEYYNLNLNDLK